MKLIHRAFETFSPLTRLRLWLGFAVGSFTANTWAHHVWSMWIFGLLTAFDIMAIIKLVTVMSPSVNLILPSPGFTETTLEELDNQLLAIARRLGQEPTTDEIRAAVLDLRSIVKDLPVTSNPPDEP